MFTEQDLVSVYTRAQAIEDGVLIDVTKNFPNEIRDCGIKFHVAMTQAAFAEAVEMTEKAEQCGCSLNARMYDVLYIYMLKARRTVIDTMFFDLRVVKNRAKPSRVFLKAMCHPGDEGEPVITISLPDED